MLQEDIFHPRPFVQTLLWDYLHLFAEPVLSSWPFNKWMREKALEEVMKFIHFEDENSRYMSLGSVEKVSYNICYI